MSAEDVLVDIAGAPYVVRVGEGLLERVGQLVPPPARKAAAAIVADEVTAGLFGPGVVASLEGAGWEPHLISLPVGESSKSLATAARLYEAFLAAGLDRSSTVFALGGGVVGDVAGFAAATYLRGIAYVPLPTTLLAQVDSSVGGKVAIDLPRGKNLVGAFHQPKAVIADTLTLCSLPRRQVANGLAEVVKHAAIADPALFGQLECSGADRLRPEASRLTHVVAANCRIKASVVSRDPEERTGLRAVLNYGHTVGHALERAAPEWELLHGEAVAWGMVAEARAAERLGLSAQSVAVRLTALLGALELLGESGPQIDRSTAEAALRSDKKTRSGRIRLPVVPEIGSVIVTEDVPVDALVAALSDVSASPSDVRSTSRADDSRAETER